MPKGDSAEIMLDEIVQDAQKQRSGRGISLTPSRLINKSVPKYMILPRVQAMIDESKRYSGAAKNRDRILCMNIIPLDKGDKYPKRLAMILDKKGPLRLAGKPCPNDSLKTSPYCSDCKKALKQ